jgi:glycosyl hydrolase family 123
LLPKDANANSGVVAAVMNKGDQMWSYTALVQDNYSPKWLLDFLPINFRIFGAISESLGLQGVLYWSVDYWSQDPWTSADYTESGHNFPGEGSLVYPGAPVGIDGVVASMRMKWLRDGIEDYEYVEILKSLGRGDWALDQVRGVASDWRHWSQDWHDLDDLRQRLGEEISRLSTSPDQQ